MEETIRAAGGVVYRTRDDGARELVVIHRPKYGDWTLPKGKLDPGETDQEAAVREVREETGLECVIERRIGTVAYRDRHGRPKRVVYYAMHRAGGEFSPNNEVDEIRWLTPREAQRLVNYEHDRRLIARIGDIPRV